MALKAIYKCGSSLILPNPQDNDVIKIYDTEQEAKEALINNRDHSIDWHFCSVEKEVNGVFLGCYIKPYMELVEGTETAGLKEFSIFAHEQEYKAVIKRYISWLPKEHKWWYHILIAYYMFENGEMKLNYEQTDMAQNVHDNGISDELYNTLVEYFN